MAKKVVYKRFELGENVKGFSSLEQKIADKYKMYQHKNNPRLFLQVDSNFIGMGALYIREAKYIKLDKEHISNVIDSIAGKGIHLHVVFDEEFLESFSELSYLPSPSDKKELFKEMKAEYWDDIWEFMEHFVITIPVESGKLQLTVQKSGILTFSLVRIDNIEQTLNVLIPYWVALLYGNDFSFDDWDSYNLPIKKEVPHEFSDLHIIVDYLNNESNLPEEVKQAFDGDLKRLLEDYAKVNKNRKILR